MQNFMALHAIALELWPFKNLKKWPFCPTIKGPDSVQKINKSAAPERAKNGAKILHYGLWEK